MTGHATLCPCTVCQRADARAEGFRAGVEAAAKVVEQSSFKGKPGLWFRIVSDRIRELARRDER